MPKTSFANYICKFKVSERPKVIDDYDLNADYAFREWICNYGNISSFSVSMNVVECSEAQLLDRPSFGLRKPAIVRGFY